MNIRIMKISDYEQVYNMWLFKVNLVGADTTLSDGFFCYYKVHKVSAYI